MEILSNKIYCVDIWQKRNNFKNRKIFCEKALHFMLLNDHKKSF